MKRKLLIVALVSLAVAIAGFFSWSQVVNLGPGDHGEHWEAWNDTIDAIWVIIPIAFVLSVLTGAASAFLKPRSRLGLVVALCVIVAAVAAAIVIFLFMSHLAIG